MTTTDIPTAPAHSSLWHRLTSGATNYEFVRRWRTWLAISGLVIVVGIGALIGRGLKLGIDFEGGTSWELTTSTLSISKARDVVGPIIGRAATIQEVCDSCSWCRGNYIDRTGCCSTGWLCYSIGRSNWLSRSC